MDLRYKIRGGENECTTGEVKRTAQSVGVEGVEINGTRFETSEKPAAGEGLLRRALGTGITLHSRYAYDQNTKKKVSKQRQGDCKRGNTGRCLKNGPSPSHYFLTSLAGTDQGPKGTYGKKEMKTMT